MIITADSLLSRPKFDYNEGYDVAVKGPNIVVFAPEGGRTQDLRGTAGSIDQPV
jgi:hypothetical protein